MRKWSGVFTKFRLFGLTEYKKVLFLDLDMLILKNLDELFDLEPPAAMMKGRRNPYHGEPIDGSLFFPGDVWNEPHGGINAGLMLLEPNAQIQNQIEVEVYDNDHPEHISCFGPEQEYLSRFYADRWTHIDGRYNFQMFRLDATRAIQKLTNRLTPGMENTLFAVQFSSHPKPWDLVDLCEDELKLTIKEFHDKSYDFAMATGPLAGEYKLCEPEEQLELTHVLVHKWIDVFAEAVKKSPEPDLADEISCDGQNLLGLRVRILSNSDNGKYWDSRPWDGTPWNGKREGTRDGKKEQSAPMAAVSPADSSRP